MALDVGPKTLEQFGRLLGPAKTIFWNGPMGVFEKPPFDHGTMALAKLVADCKAVTVVGGGESVQAAHEAGVAEKFTHVSTGGGASLEFLAEGSCPESKRSRETALRRQLEDAQDPRGGAGVRGGARREARIGDGEVAARASSSCARRRSPLLDAARDPAGRWGLACQNVAAEAAGAFTGEVSARMAADAGCTLRDRGALREAAPVRRGLGARSRRSSRAAARPGSRRSTASGRRRRSATPE